MSKAIARQVAIAVEWDDSVMFVFSFQAAGGQVYCGFPHFGLASQTASGTNMQVTPQLQVAQQLAIQISADPGTWIETLKAAARGGKVTIVYDDTINVHYTTQTADSFDLYQLYSITG